MNGRASEGAEGEQGGRVRAVARAGGGRRAMTGRTSLRAGARRLVRATDSAGGGYDECTTELEYGRARWSRASSRRIREYGRVTGGLRRTFRSISGYETGTVELELTGFTSRCSTWLQGGTGIRALRRKQATGRLWQARESTLRAYGKTAAASRQSYMGGTVSGGDWCYDDTMGDEYDGRVRYDGRRRRAMTRGATFGHGGYVQRNCTGFGFTVTVWRLRCAFIGGNLRAVGE